MRLVAGLSTGVAVALLVASGLGVRLQLPTFGRPVRFVAGMLRGLRPAGAASGRLAAVCGGVALVVFMLVGSATGSILVAVVPSLAATLAVLTYFRTQEEERDKERLSAWPDALRSVVASLEAGRSLHQSLAGLAETGPPPLREVFARYELAAEAVGEVAALDLVRRQMAHPVSDTVFEVLKAASTRGSRVVLPILRRIADDTTADLQLSERLQTTQSEQRISAWVVFVVPWLTLVLLCARPGPFRDFYSGTEGIPVLLLATTLSLAGMAAVRYFARTPPEPRILADTRRESAR